MGQIKTLKAVVSKDHDSSVAFMVAKVWSHLIDHSYPLSLSLSFFAFPFLFSISLASYTSRVPSSRLRHTA